ncbi:hypothetical protein M9H77_31118 [Catharanthus roseus]|uniref:Uncharacterized protein n=1 Tax=Catharanthus roseus TaxID=4058 RepID=A0ACC0A041_CATRO|nr:hypothetical protein M9H77_31118 [Catharanthus roseus]
MINKHLSNLKKSKKKWLDPLILISRTKRSINQNPDVYRYKWSNRSKNFQEYFEHFVSEEKSYSPFPWKRLVLISIITILRMDNSLISCSFTTKYFLCASVKKHAFWERDTISPIDS